MDNNMKHISSDEHSAKLSAVKKYFAPTAAVVAAGIFAVLAVAPFAADSTAVSGEETVYESVVETDIISEDTEVLISAADGEKIGEYIKVTVEADGDELEVSVKAGSTVAEVLEKAEIELDEDDIAEPALDTEIEEESVVTVTRVEYLRQTHVRSYRFGTDYREDETLPEGESEVIVDGEEGEIVIETLAKIVNGELEDVEILSKEITKPAVNRVILKGAVKADAADVSEPEAAEPETVQEPESEEETVPAAQAEEETDDMAEIFSDEDDAAPTGDFIKIIEPEMHSEDEHDIPEDIYLDTIDPKDVPCVSRLTPPEWLKLDEDGIPVSYTTVHTGRSCAYTASPDALMSTGKAVFQGYVAVNPDLIPYGSELYIIADDGSVYGYAIAADTGSSVRKGRIVVDLFMNEYDDCIQWGNRSVTVYVLN